VQRLATGGQNRELRAIREQRADPGSNGREMLEIVQNQQQASVPEICSDGFARRGVGRIAYLQRPRDGRRHVRRFVNPRELGECDAKFEAARSFRRYPYREARFSDTGRSGQRHEPHAFARQKRA
jgi:hypothetical protein